MLKLARNASRVKVLTAEVYLQASKKELKIQKKKKKKKELCYW